jgi:hypothetical protein
LGQMQVPKFPSKQRRLPVLLTAKHRLCTLVLLTGRPLYTSVHLLRTLRAILLAIQISRESLNTPKICGPDVSILAGVQDLYQRQNDQSLNTSRIGLESIPKNVANWSWAKDDKWHTFSVALHSFSTEEMSRLESKHRVLDNV